MMCFIFMKQKIEWNKKVFDIFFQTCSQHKNKRLCALKIKETSPNSFKFFWLCIHPQQIDNNIFTLIFQNNDFHCNSISNCIENFFDGKQKKIEKKLWEKLNFSGRTQRSSNYTTKKTFICDLFFQIKNIIKDRFGQLKWL